MTSTPIHSPLPRSHTPDQVAAEDGLVGLLDETGGDGLVVGRPGEALLLRQLRQGLQEGELPVTRRRRSGVS